MKKPLLISFSAFIVAMVFTCCEGKRQEPQERHVIDITRYKADGDPVGTHRSADGDLIDNNNVFAPRAGESSEQFKARNGYDGSTSSNPYDEGYEDGYEEGYEAGKSESNN